MAVAAHASPVRNAAGTLKRVVIVGAGLGGLSAAIHLRLAGHEVIIYERDARVGGRANLLELDGFRFDTGPSLVNYPWVFEELFRAARRDLYDYVSLLPVDPSISFRWRDGERLTLSSDRAALVTEFARFEPGAADAVEHFFRTSREKYRIAFEKLACRNEDNPLKWLTALSRAEMLQTGMWRSVWSELSRSFQSRHIREALGSYSMYLGGSPFSLPGMFTILPYGELEYGLWLPRGGVYGLVEAIEQLARELGVVIRTETPVHRIETQAGSVTGLVLQDGERVSADVVVSNVDLPTTQARLLGEPAPKVAMTPGVVTFYWGVRGRPAGLGHHTIFLPEDYKGTFAELLDRGGIPDDLPFYVSVPSETDASLAPPGDSCVFVLVPVPVLSKLGSVDWADTVAEIRRKVLARLHSQAIELPASSIVTERCFTPVDWSARFGLYDGSAFGAAHTLFQVGPFRARNQSRRYAGLFYVGSSTTPGAGMPMVILSGRMTAERVGAYVR
jgi:phytoene desaturase